MNAKKRAPLLAQEAPRRNGSAQVYHGQEKKSSGYIPPEPPSRNPGCLFAIIAAVAAFLLGVLVAMVISSSIHQAEAAIMSSDNYITMQREAGR